MVTLQGIRGVCPSDACPTSSAGSGACVSWVRVSRGSASDLKSSACDSPVGARFSFLVLFRVTCTVVSLVGKKKHRQVSAARQTVPTFGEVVKGGPRGVGGL